MAKNHNFDGQILTFLRAPVPTFFDRRGPNLVCYSRTTVYAYVPHFVWIALFCRPLLAKTPILPFFGLRHLVLSPVGSSLRRLNTSAQLQNFLSNGIKIVSVLQRLHGEIGRTISDVQKCDGQKRDGQTKNSTFLVTSAAGEIRAPPNLVW